MTTASALRTALACTVIALALVPLSTGAQTAAQDSLRATIKAEIMADPRSSGMSQAQINAMVDSLAVEAQKQGITAQDLTAPRPQVAQQQEAAAPPVTQACGAGFFCTIDEAFGFLGSDSTIPVVFFIICALFVLIFSIMREMGHPHAQFDKGKQA